jgi:hypothetical protein
MLLGSVLHLRFWESLQIVLVSVPNVFSFAEFGLTSFVEMLFASNKIRLFKLM